MTAKKRKTSAKKLKDLRGDVGTLRKSIASAHGKAPGRDKKQSALYFAYRSIIRPRLPRFTPTLDDLLKTRRWIRGEDGTGNELQPVVWDHVIRRIATRHHAAMAGALAQYHTVRLVWRSKTQFGFKKGSNAPVGSKKEIKQQKDQAKAELEEKTAAIQADYKKTMEMVLKAWAARRDALREQMETFRSILDALMAAEEKRLQRQVRLTEPVVMDKGQVLLDAMKDLSGDAKTFSTEDGSEAARYDDLLRKWNGKRRETVRIIA